VLFNVNPVAPLRFAPGSALQSLRSDPIRLDEHHSIKARSWIAASGRRTPKASRYSIGFV